LTSKAITEFPAYLETIHT